MSEERNYKKDMLFYWTYFDNKPIKVFNDINSFR